MKCSKAFDMRYHWLKDGVARGQFNLYWMGPGKLNGADYCTKHYPLSHHKLMRSLYLQQPQGTNNPYARVCYHYGQSICIVERLYAVRFLTNP